MGGQAGGPDTDLVLAVTNHDEVNMAACQVAYSLFRTPKKIARIRSTEYLRHPEIFCDESIPIDVIISPEQVITQRILHLIEYPGALQVVDFAGGEIQLVALKAYYGGPLVGRQLRSIRDDLPGVEARVAAIYRQNRPIIPEGNTVIEPDDEVFFVAAAPDIPVVMGELRSVEKPGRNIMLAGAGNIGGQLARRLEQNHYHVKLVEHAYVDLIDSLLDIAISPSQETVGSLLTHVRRGDMVAVHSLRRGAAEAIETIAHGDASSSRVVGRRIDEIPLPSGTTFGALMRKDEVVFPHHDTVIEAEDHVILFVIDKRHIRDVERLFQVKVTFV